MAQIKFESYKKDIKNNWLIVLATTLLGILLSIFVNTSLKNSYVTSTFLYVNLLSTQTLNQTNLSVDDFSDNLVGLVNGGVVKDQNANFVAKKISPQIVSINSKSNFEGGSVSGLKTVIEKINLESQKLTIPNQQIIIIPSENNFTEFKIEVKKQLNIFIGLLSGFLIGIGIVGLRKYFEN
ncbi:MAG TPA: hypothetical protein VIK81_01945 [Patescibacteria group bacterium]